MRARFKKFEDIAKEDICCEVAEEEMKKASGSILYIVPPPEKMKSSICDNCKTEFPCKMVYMLEKPLFDGSNCVAVSMIDIDEGE